MGILAVSGKFSPRNLYIRTQDGSFLHDTNEDRHYDTERFYDELDYEVEKERSFFDNQSRPFSSASIEKALSDPGSINYSENLRHILVNVYQHREQQKSFSSLADAVADYLAGQESTAATKLKSELKGNGWEQRNYHWTLKSVKDTLLALGIFPESNDYLNLTLKEYLQKHSLKGSFTLWPEVLSYIRLAMHQDRKIDITSISAFWTKYYQRKDYTLLSLDEALSVFEERGFVHWKNSVDLLTYLQEISEKGYRGILASYFMLHKPEFIIEVLQEYELSRLNISWFDLDVAYINVLPERVYNYEINNQMHYNRYSGEIEISNIENVLHSQYFENLKADLTWLTVTVKEDDQHIDFLKTHRIRFKVLKEEQSYSKKDSPQSRFEQGILDMKNQFIIKEKGLQPTEVALMQDGHHPALADPDIYGVFSKNILREQLKPVLYNLLTGRSAYTSSFHLPWLLPGNMLRLLSDSNAEINFEELFDSFCGYLRLSMLELKVKSDLVKYPYSSLRQNGPIRELDQPDSKNETKIPKN